MRARRALLYMPGDNLRKIEKGARSNVDCVCMDIEDGVAATRKDVARETIAASLRSLNFGESERLVRINAVGSGMESDDLSAALPARPDGIVVPKVEEADQLHWVSDQIQAIEKSHGWPARSIRLIAIIETAMGIVHLSKIASASPRLDALVFGAEDLAGDIGATRTKEGWEVFYARSAVVTHAAAYKLQAIDMVFVDFHDLDGLRQEALNGASMGFSGKQIIHPNQIKPVQEAYTPDEATIAQALKVMEIYKQHQSVGLGAFAFEGKMIDAPMVKIAEQILARARAAGRL
jgi:citrate lyase beta subunit